MDATPIDREDGLMLARHAIVADHALAGPPPSLPPKTGCHRAAEEHRHPCVRKASLTAKTTFSRIPLSDVGA